MTLISADVIWPALFLKERLLSVWVIEPGLLVERAPDDACWDDLMHEIYVLQAIEAGPARG